MATICLSCTCQVIEMSMDTIDLNRFVIYKITGANTDSYYCLNCREKLKLPKEIKSVLSVIEDHAYLHKH